jgi:hypothetical protein
MASSTRQSDWERSISSSRVFRYLCYRRAGPTLAGNASSGLTRGRPGNAESLDAAVQASEARRAVALAMSSELVKRMTPLQLMMLAAIFGFVAGRKW